MQIISSYGVELRKQNIPIRQTLEIYRSAVSYLIGIYVQVWEKLAEIPDAKRRFNAAEHLVHTTKKNHACFDFDIRFPKMPSYLRRSAIQHVLGTVSSYKTRLDLWEKTDGKSGKPKLVYENHAMPVFYRDVMYREGAERELLKSLPAMERSLLEAKVPSVKRRTSCVYADLRKLHSEMELLKAA